MRWDFGVQVGERGWMRGIFSAAQGWLPEERTHAVQLRLAGAATTDSSGLS
jgi:hypothetical protein